MAKTPCYDEATRAGNVSSLRGRERWVLYAGRKAGFLMRAGTGFLMRGENLISLCGPEG